MGRAGPSCGLLAGDTALADIEPCKLFLRRLVAQVCKQSINQ